MGQLGPLGRKFFGIAKSVFRHVNVGAKLAGLLFLLLGAVMLSACDNATRYDWRQKIEVIVDTPSGEVSGASVQQITMRKGKGVPKQGSNTAVKVTAEAVVIDLGRTRRGPRYLFALIGGTAGLLPHLAKPVYGIRSHQALKAADAVSQGTRFTLEKKVMPFLVTFDDINDPASVKRVDPDDLDASFGPGYTLKSITLEITDEPVTSGRVESVLGWWLSYRGGPYNSLKSLKLPNNSPRGWKHLPATNFWSLDQVLEFNEAKQ